MHPLLRHILSVFLFALIFSTSLSSVFAFTDTSGHPYEQGIDFAEQNHIVTGYPDGTFRPERTINRAEFVTLLMRTKYAAEMASGSGRGCFSDVKSTDWFSLAVCLAKEKGIVNGYPNGTFRPAKDVTLAEAAKISGMVFGLPLPDFPEGEWYRPFLETLGTKHFLLPSFSGPDHALTRAEMTELIRRIQTDDTESATISTEELLHPSCLRFSEPFLPGVDMAEVRRVWLQWINDARAEKGLAPYVYNSQLNRTAVIWSEFSADRNEGSHKRPGQTAYYDYPLITSWFRNLGLTFANLHGVTYSENIGWWPYRCGETSCTEEVIGDIRHTFDGYMAEKGTSYTAHYNSVMNGYFREIGMGIAVSAEGILYITTHYATEITSDPLPICEGML